MEHIELDALTARFGGIHHAWARESAYHLLIGVLGGNLQHGFCLDSAAVTHFYRAEYGVFGAFGVARARAALGSRVILVLSKADVRQQLDAMQKFRKLGKCWTVGHFSDAQLASVAEGIVLQCKVLSEVTDKSLIATAWIDPLDFERSVASEARRCADLVIG